MLCGVLLGRQKLALGCLSGGRKKSPSRCSLNSNLKGLSISSQTRHISARTPLLDWFVRQLPGNLSALSSAITGLTHFKSCELRRVPAGPWRGPAPLLHWNISSWLYNVRVLHGNNGDPSGVQWSVSVGAADMKVESAVSHSSFAFFFFQKRKNSKQPWIHVSSQFISQAKSSQLSCGKEGSVTSACPGLLILQGNGSTLTKQQPGSVLHPPNQPRSRTQTWLARVLLTRSQ